MGSYDRFSNKSDWWYSPRKSPMLTEDHLTEDDLQRIRANNASKGMAADAEALLMQMSLSKGMTVADLVIAAKSKKLGFDKARVHVLLAHLEARRKVRKTGSGEGTRWTRT